MKKLLRCIECERLLDEDKLYSVYSERAAQNVNVCDDCVVKNNSKPKPKKSPFMGGLRKFSEGFKI